MANSRTLERFLQKPKALSRKTWRESLRNRVGPSGERLWDIMLDIAEGRVWRPQYTDEAGKVVTGEPIAPTAGDRLSAARELAHMLYGKPVPQTEASRAEEDAKTLDAVRALTDAELEARVKKALSITDAEIVPETPQLSDGGSTPHSSQTPENSIDSTHPGANEKT